MHIVETISDSLLRDYFFKLKTSNTLLDPGIEPVQSINRNRTCVQRDSQEDKRLIFDRL